MHARSRLQLARRARCGLVATLVLAWLAGPAFADVEAEAQTPPDPTLEAARQTIEALYVTLRDITARSTELGYEGRRDAVAPAVDESYDLAFMAEKALGRHWKKLGDEERERWRSAFATLTVSTYAERFEEDGGQTLVVEDAEPARRDTVVVHTRIDRPKEEPVEINYRMREVDGQWRIIDVYLNGTVSELALRRSEYTTVIERDGFEHLVQSLEAKHGGS